MNRKPYSHEKSKYDTKGKTDEKYTPYPTNQPTNQKINKLILGQIRIYAQHTHNHTQVHHCCATEAHSFDLFPFYYEILTRLFIDVYIRQYNPLKET